MLEKDYTNIGDTMKRMSIKKRKRKIKRYLIILLIFLGMFLSYKKLEKTKIKITDKDFIHLIAKDTFQYEEKNIVEEVVDKALKVSNPIKWMNYNYKKQIKKEVEKPVIRDEEPPIIYLYNSHQTEEYAPSNYAEFSVNPTVMMVDYILEDYFQKKGHKAIVEENSIKEILNQNNWNYSNSYKASRVLLEESIIRYPTLKYFIDIHRDSLKKEKTTATINEKKYAKILFIVGLENGNYLENLSFTEKINNKLAETYPGLTKGIYKKSGPGVNGVYNQDFSPNTILVEIGGYENNTTEVLNSTLAFAEAFMEVIHE